MASLASGVSLTLGLISTTVRVESAKEAETSLNQICMGQPGHDEHAPVKLTQPATCALCGKIEDATAIKKGKPSGDGFLVVDATEINEIKKTNAEPFKKRITLGAHPREQFELETQRGEKLYYLVPDGQADIYALILQLVKDTPDAAICGLWTPRSVAGLFQLRAYERDGHEALVLEERIASAKLKPVPATAGNVDPALLTLAKQFVSQVIEPLDMTNYDDGYQAKVDALFSSKQVIAAHGGGAGSGSAKASTSPDDLAAKLRESLAASGKPAKKAPAKRANARPRRSA